MYDARSEPNEFFGDSLAEAVAKATRFFEIEESELTVREPPPGNIFGLGSRSAIVAYPTALGPRRPGGSGGAERSDSGSDRGGDRGRGRDRGSRDRGRGRERGGRGERGGSGRASNRREEREGPEAAPPRARKRAEPQESTGTATGEITAVGEYVLGVVERMALGSFELSETEDNDYLVVEIRGVAAEGLSEEDSRAIAALQLLANQAALQADESPKRVVIDCGSDSTEGQESFIERAADRAARRAIETGRSVALDPMNGRDRRLVHVALRETDGVATMSHGQGRYRQVVIVPEGDPDYDEAVEASRDIETRD